MRRRGDIRERASRQFARSCRAPARAGRTKSAAWLLRILGLIVCVSWGVPEPCLALQRPQPRFTLLSTSPLGDPAATEWRVVAEAETGHLDASEQALPAPVAETPEQTPADTQPLKRRLSLIVPGLVSIGVLANQAWVSFGDHPTGGFHATEEGWFGEGTYVGGADKTAHFVKFEILAREFAHLYEYFGFSRRQSLIGGFGMSMLTGLVNELGDATNMYGFSYEDLVMDALGASAAVLTSVTDTRDLFGFRVGPLFVDAPPKEEEGMGHDYTKEIYTADLQLGGVARRLGLPLWPMRFLLLSATYGVWGYPYGAPDKRERLIGMELGLNFAEVLYAFNVQEDTWWGFLAHGVFDNVRIPYTQFGFRYDLNHHGWYAVNGER